MVLPISPEAAELCPKESPIISVPSCNTSLAIEQLY